jgi:cell division protein FtsW (lipid II flippase)
MRNPRVFAVVIYGILAGILLLAKLPTRWWIIYLIGGAIIVGVLWSQLAPSGSQTSPNPARAARRARRRNRRGGTS